MVMLKVSTHWGSVRSSRRQLKICKDSSAGRLNTKVLPIDPSQPCGQVRSVPLLATLSSDLPPETSVNVGQRFHLVRVIKDFTKEGDVSDGKS